MDWKGCFRKSKGVKGSSFFVLWSHSLSVRVELVVKSWAVSSSSSLRFKPFAWNAGTNVRSVMVRAPVRIARDVPGGSK